MCVLYFTKGMGIYLILISAKTTFVHQLKSSQNKYSSSNGKDRKISLRPEIADPPQIHLIQIIDHYLKSFLFLYLKKFWFLINMAKLIELMAYDL